MKKKLFLLFLAWTTFSFSQEKEIINSYKKYFENTREVPFLHLNKTTFLKGEEIWFKAYIQEQNSHKLHPTTSNLYVSIFEENGKLKAQHLIHIKNGLGTGNIPIDSTYTEKNYYVKASTKWMKNFKEDNAFYQKITIISAEDQKTIANKTPSYEFQLFPEGGHLISNTVNNIALLIKDSNGNGLNIEKGIIKDQDNKVIRHFKTNKNGMSKIPLYIKDNMIYTFSIILSNGIRIEQKTKTPSNYGATINLINEDNKLGIRVITNDATLKNISKKNFKILVHNTRNFREYNLNLTKQEKNYILILDKKDVSSGINIITLFNQNNIPISERLFFNHSNLSSINLDKKITEITNDSIQVQFQNNSNEKIFLSASFLPLHTKAYNPENNINSTFHLKPYVKGHIKNAHEYFKDLQNKKQQRNLDLLLLTQGWSKYNWTDIFSGSQKLNHPFENGIDLTANFNTEIKKKHSIILFSKENNLIRTFRPINKKWTLKNSFLKRNSILKVALMNKEGDLNKITPSLSFSSGQIIDHLNIKTSPSFKLIETPVINFKVSKEYNETLNEVEIKARKRKTAHKDHPLTGSFRYAGRDDFIKGTGENVFDYINFKTPPDKKVTTLYLDGKNIIRQPWLMNGLYMDQIKEIFYGNDLDRLGYVFYIFTLTPKEYRNHKNSNSNLKLKLGFSIEKEYYSPQYPSYTNKNFHNYGSVYWTPKIVVSTKSNSKITIPTHFQNSFVMYLEGISESGKLISERHIINKGKHVSN